MKFGCAFKTNMLQRQTICATYTTKLVRPSRRGRQTACLDWSAASAQVDRQDCMEAEKFGHWSFELVISCYQ